jgi:hypothetical protein
VISGSGFPAPTGAKVAQIDLARRLAEAIWHMLSRDQPFAPKGATDPWPPDGP